MELLRTPDIQGYPTGYLLSRIRGRRSRLVKDWAALVFDAALTNPGSPESPGSAAADESGNAAWINLLREYGWVYRQMNPRLRAMFAPFFFYTELKTLIMGLRQIQDAKERNINELLDASLLSDEITDILLLSPDRTTAIHGLENLLSEFSSDYRGIAERLDSGGLRSVEQKLVATCLSSTISAGMHPLMKQFFMRLIDSRNIMSLYKALRFDRQTPPIFIPGGLLPESRMQAAAKQDDITGIGALIRAYTGIVIEQPDSSAVELALYRGMTRWLKKKGQRAGAVGLVLDYLWRCSIEAMNRSMLAYGRNLERESVLAELVS